MKLRRIWWLQASSAAASGLNQAVWNPSGGCAKIVEFIVHDQDPTGWLLGYSPQDLEDRPVGLAHTNRSAHDPGVDEAVEAMSFTQFVGPHAGVVGYDRNLHALRSEVA
ncbi:MAG: hypothetical protein R2706_05020 [Acidimicrobiales bacterium]